MSEVVTVEESGEGVVNADNNIQLQFTVRVIRIETLLFRQFLSPGCINLKNLCGHLQEKIWRIPKHPQLAKFFRFMHPELRN